MSELRRALRKSVNQILADVGKCHPLMVGAYQISPQLRTARGWLCAFFAGGFVAGGVGGALGLIFSFTGLTAGGIGMTCPSCPVARTVVGLRGMLVLTRPTPAS